MQSIEKIIVSNLHGNKDVEMNFKDNRLIIVGENGSGKTTILRIIYYLLSKQWLQLLKYNFEGIHIFFSKEEIELKKDYILSKFDVEKNSMFKRIPMVYRLRYIANENISLELRIKKLEGLLNRHNISAECFFDEESHSKTKDNNFNPMRKLDGLLENCNILYLPTYRRIEKELEEIVNIRHEEDEDEDEEPTERITSCLELVEFGMNDVRQSIHQTLINLKDSARETLNKLTLGYLDDIVGETYRNPDFNMIHSVADDEIEKILSRIGEDILSVKNKEKLLHSIQKAKNCESQKDIEQLSENQKVICHYFAKLLLFQHDLEEKEKKIRSFCNICNKYMYDKKFDYLSSSFEFFIKSITQQGTTIRLEQLSSGEKQIVSLFSHLYLSKKENYFVMIDEPELSLSVPWQRKFLVDICRGNFCKGLIAVTHSPFIYDNELEQYVHGLGEFTKLR